MILPGLYDTSGLIKGYYMQFEMFADTKMACWMGERNVEMNKLVTAKQHPCCCFVNAELRSLCMQKKLKITTHE
jgi:hypothetical protein